jgi:hypothetical protein
VLYQLSYLAAAPEDIDGARGAIGSLAGGGAAQSS